MHSFLLCTNKRTLKIVNQTISVKVSTYYFFFEETFQNILNIINFIKINKNCVLLFWKFEFRPSTPTINIARVSLWAWLGQKFPSRPFRTDHRLFKIVIIFPLLKINWKVFAYFFVLVAVLLGAFLGINHNWNEISDRSITKRTKSKLFGKKRQEGEKTINSTFLLTVVNC